MPPNIVRREIAFVVLLNICGMTHNFQPTPAEQVRCHTNTSGFGTFGREKRVEAVRRCHLMEGVYQPICGIYRLLCCLCCLGGRFFLNRQLRNRETGDHHHQPGNDVVNEYGRSGVEFRNERGHDHP